MHIHKIYSGDKKQYRRLLLRRSYRDQGAPCQLTLANLSKWKPEHVLELELALQKCRRLRGTTDHSTALGELYGLLIARLGPKAYMLFQEPMPRSLKRG